MKIALMTVLESRAMVHERQELQLWVRVPLDLIGISTEIKFTLLLILSTIYNYIENLDWKVRAQN